jgi:hypothetical protein
MAYMLLVSGKGWESCAALLTCQTRDEAVQIARECPATQWATIEVRKLGPCFQ